MVRATHEIESRRVADANFGIFERDVEIAAEDRGAEARPTGTPARSAYELREEHGQAPAARSSRSSRTLGILTEGVAVAPVDGRARR